MVDAAEYIGDRRRTLSYRGVGERVGERAERRRRLVEVSQIAEVRL
jgi:hypothetical protein